MAQCAVIGAPHPDFGEGVIAVVVKSAGAALDEAELQRSLSTKLAKFKRPKHIFVVDKLPLNAMGKVQKNQLRERYAAVFAA